MNIEEFLSRKTRPTATKTFVLDAELAARIRRLESRVNDLEAGDGDQARVEAVRAELDQAKDEARPISMTFTFQALPAEEYDRLQAEHPPTRDQKAEFAKTVAALVKPGMRPELGYNPDTFPPALIAASAVDPAMTLEQATELWDSDRLSRIEATELFQTAMEPNITSSSADLRAS